MLTTDFTLIDCYSTEEFTWYIECLKNQQLVFQTGAGPTNVQLTLSMEGWNRVQPVPRTGGISDLILDMIERFYLQHE